MSVVFTVRGRVGVERRYASGIARQAYYTGSVPLVGAVSYSYNKIYRTQPWVAAAVNKFARGIGQLPLKVFTDIAVEGEDQIDRQRVQPSDDGPGTLPKLLRNPYPRCSPTRFKVHIGSSLGVYGNTLLVKANPYDPAVHTRTGERPVELYPVDWWRVDTIEDPPGQIAYFNVRDDIGHNYPFLPDEVVHIGFWAPDSPVGISPLEPLRRTLAIEDAAVRETIASFTNAGRPSGAFTSTQGRPFTEDQAREIRKNLEELYGGVDNAYRIAVIGGGLDWKSMSFSHQEQELIPTRKLTREEVAAAYGIDPTQLGILDRATFSNVTEAHRSFYQDSLGPWLTQIEEDLEIQLIAPEPAWAGLDLEFDMNEVLKSDIESRMRAYMAGIQVGLTPNEIRHFENLPPLSSPMADEGYVQLNLQPLSGGVMPAQGQAGLASLAELLKPYLNIPEPSRNGDHSLT